MSLNGKSYILRQLDHLIAKQVGTQDNPSGVRTDIARRVKEFVLASKSDGEAIDIFNRHFDWRFDTVSGKEQKFQIEMAEYLGPEIVEKYVPVLTHIERTDEEKLLKDVVRGRPLNRFNPGFKTVMSPIPEITEDTPKFTLEEVCAKAADRFHEIGKDKQIYVLWSGGIDSTLALHCLKEAGIKFKVIMDEDSLEEHTSLAKDLIAGRYDIVTGVIFSPKPPEYNKLLQDPNNIFISGGHGDEVFGGEAECDGEFKYADNEYSYYAPADIDEVTKPWIEKLIGDMSGMTVCEWRWAVNFIYKWQQVQVSSMFMLGIGMVDGFNNRNGYHFYDTEEFQIWSIQNYKSLCGDNKDKAIAKKAILDIDGDEAYYLYKRKVCSMKKTLYRTGSDFFKEKKVHTYASTLASTDDERELGGILKGV